MGKLFFILILVILLGSFIVTFGNVKFIWSAEESLANKYQDYEVDQSCTYTGIQSERIGIEWRFWKNCAYK